VPPFERAASHTRGVHGSLRASAHARFFRTPSHPATTATLRRRLHRTDFIECVGNFKTAILSVVDKLRTLYTPTVATAVRVAHCTLRTSDSQLLALVEITLCVSGTRVGVCAVLCGVLLCLVEGLAHAGSPSLLIAQVRKAVYGWLNLPVMERGQLSKWKTLRMRSLSDKLKARTAPPAAMWWGLRGGAM
jgi:hypothetical protein